MAGGRGDQETLIVIQVLKSASGISVVPNASRYCKSQCVSTPLTLCCALPS